MFQLALSEALRRQHPDERVLLDLHGFRGYRKHRGFELASAFGISYEEASLRDVARIAYPYPDYQSWRIGSRLLPSRKTMLCEARNFRLEPTALSRPGDTYYDGYWQHEEYFRDIREELLSLFRFPELTGEQNLHCRQRIGDTGSCSIHIRRGDYLTDPLRRGTTGLDYTNRAIKRMKELADPECWCVFSDDIEWAKEHLSKLLPKATIIYSEWNQGEKSVHDMHLMSLCQHNIIANSSFSWWGAWLSTRTAKVIIAPNNWMNMEDVCSPVPTGWLRI